MDGFYGNRLLESQHEILLHTGNLWDCGVEDTKFFTCSRGLAVGVRISCMHVHCGISFDRVGWGRASAGLLRLLGSERCPPEMQCKFMVLCSEYLAKV